MPEPTPRSRTPRETTALAILLLSAALSGCTAQRPTEILLVIDADAELAGSGLDELIILVGREQGTPESKTISLSGAGQFPLSFGLFHDGGPFGPIAITVSARRSGKDVVVRKAITHFLPGEIHILRMDLYAQCAARACDTDQTCTEEGCVSLAEAGKVIDWTKDPGPAPPFTGSRADGGADAGSPDGGSPVPDAPADPSPDANTLLPPPDTLPPADTTPLEPIAATEAARALGSCELFPGNPVFANDISNPTLIKASPFSAAYLASMNANTTNLSADFGGDPDLGFAWISVPDTELARPLSVQIGFAPTPAPLPLDARTRLTGRHLIVAQTGTCSLYEGSNCVPAGGGWSCYAAARWNLQSFTNRPAGSVSADPSGLPILALLVRWKEVQSGLIPHMLRFTAEVTQQGRVSPATAHAGGQSTDASLPPMGLRLRLRADFDPTGYSAAARVIITALKTYGMVLSGHGANFALAGETHPGWTKALKAEIATIPGTAFEAIEHASVVR